MALLTDSPENAIRDEIHNFASKTLNKWKSQPEGLPYFDTPLVGFADVHDQLFSAFKNIIGAFHLTPLEVLEHSFPEHKEPWDGASVISWITPIAKHIRESNRQETRYPSKLWIQARTYVEEFNTELKDHVVAFLQEKGFLAVVPTLSSLFEVFQSDELGFTSNWSERHVAYVAGLGTFGLSGALISERGVAIRFGSVVTNLQLLPAKRSYDNYKAYCLYNNAEECGKCIDRCPSGAISTKGQGKDPCMMHCAAILQERGDYYEGVPGCGLCLTAVPCEAGIPKSHK
jgi:epoxyqueuosine reductase QueG